MCIVIFSQRKIVRLHRRVEQFVLIIALEQVLLAQYISFTSIATNKRFSKSQQRDLTILSLKAIVSLRVQRLQCVP